MNYYNEIAFIIILIFCTISLFKKQNNEHQSKLHITDFICRYEKPILIFVAVAAVIIRAWRFGQIPEGVNQDGAMAAVDAYALANYGTDRFGTFMPAHLYAWGASQMSSLMSYLMVPWMWALGLNTLTMRLPTLIMSLIGGVFFWYFSREAFGKNVGMLAAFFCAIDPWHFMQSRWALEANMLPHFFIIGVCLLYLGCNKKKVVLYISMVFFGLCMYCYGVSIYTVPVFLVMTCVFLLIKHVVSFKNVLVCILIYLAVSWPFYLTMAINTFGWETIAFPFVTCQLFPDSTRAGDILFFSDHPITQLWENIKYLFNATVIQKKDASWNDITGFGTMYLFSMPFALCGIVSMIKKRKESGTVILLFMLLTGIVCGCLTNYVNVNRMNIIYYAMMLLIVLGIDYVFSKIEILSIPVIACYAASAVLLLSTYFGSYADEIKHDFYYGFGEMLIAAEETGSDTIYITADTQSTGSVDVSRILTMFYDKTDAEYFQGKTDINNGKRCLPFTERFKFMSFNMFNMPELKDGTACVIRMSDIPLFSDNYNITAFGDYAMAVPK